MHSYLIIGMGKFGRYLTQSLARMGHEVMIADQSEELVTRMTEFAVSARVADCTIPEALASFGVNHFDACIVCIGDNFQASLEITDMLRDMGARHIVSMAATDTQAKFLLKNGADDVIFPERDTAERIAVSLGHDSIFDYFRLSGEYGIYEVATPPRWQRHTILSLNVRSRYRVTILAIKPPDRPTYIPEPDYAFNTLDHLILMGKPDDIARIVGHD